MNQELINNIKNWINVDNEIKKLQKNIKSLREEKKKFRPYNTLRSSRSWKNDFSPYNF